MTSLSVGHLIMAVKRGFSEVPGQHIVSDADLCMQQVWLFYWHMTNRLLPKKPTKREDIMPTSTRRDLPPCDLVMKGGVTSGIVYPPAIQELSRKYRFRKIGGTSAGAIAAACAAAAEFGSECGKQNSGFAGLQQMSDWLGKDQNLLGLFQAAPKARPLLKTLLALMTPSQGKQKQSFLKLAARSTWRLTAALARYDFRSFLIGALIGVCVAMTLRWLTLAGSGLAILFPAFGIPLIWFFFSAILSAWLGGVLVGIVHLARILVVDVPSNLYGMCVGHSDPSDSTPILTDWLCGQINTLAGLAPTDAPLTFGKLTDSDISLTCITSNLSQGQPYDLPFQQNVWIFEEGEMRKLFPEAIVRHMIDKAHQSTRVSLEKLKGYHFLPESADLPIAVAMRMSLSFPVLISAVPLYTIKPSAFSARQTDGITTLKDVNDLERNWFSDGGISSNFPIHFFDAWLPTCPTFGINLCSMRPDLVHDHVKALAGNGHESSKKVAVALDGQVFLPFANAVQAPEWKPLPELGDFLGAIWNTAQNYRDNTQSMLPSYRERIVNIRLSDDEGGLNLTMGPKSVQAVQSKGQEAGALLRDSFDLRAHQWVRLQVLMSQLEAELKQLVPVITSKPYEDLLDDSPNGLHGGASTLPYGRDLSWCTEAKERLELIVTAISQWNDLDNAWLTSHGGWGKNCFFPYLSPKPEPALRVTPRL